MKKTMIFMAFFLFATIIETSGQAFIIYNYTCEQVTVNVLAEDNASPPSGCGGWVSNPIVIPSSGYVSMNTPAWMNLSGCSYSGGLGAPGWATIPYASTCYDYTATPPANPWGFDGAIVANSTATVNVGNGGGCLGYPHTQTTTVYESCGPNYMTATWYPTLVPYTVELDITD